MALTLTVEDGSASALSNCYISQADCLTFLEGRLNSSEFAAASDDNQKASIVHAAAVLDQLYQWNGFKKTPDQAMQWPRVYAPDPDQLQSNLNQFQLRSFSNIPVYLDESSVPSVIVSANAELALAMLKTDRLKNPAGEGLSSFSLAGTISVVFDQMTKMDPLPDHIRAMLSRYGSPLFGRSGTVQLIRA